MNYGVEAELELECGGLFLPGKAIEFIEQTKALDTQNRQTMAAKCCSFNRKAEIAICLQVYKFPLLIYMGDNVIF